MYEQQLQIMSSKNKELREVLSTLLKKTDGLLGIMNKLVLSILCKSKRKRRQSFPN